MLPAMGQSAGTAETHAPATEKKAVVVIDPAFGGKEKGFVTKAGLEEQTVVFEIAETVQRLFAGDRDIEVRLTRTANEYVSVSDREKTIVGYSPLLVLRLRMGKSKFDVDEGFFCRYDPRNAKSREFAEILLERYDQKVIFLNEGVKPAKIYRAAHAPTVEFFMGYLSNPSVEANFRDSETRRTVATVICEAIARYVQNEDPVMKGIATCMANLKQLGLPLHAYGADNQGRYPDSLTDLYLGKPPYVSVPYPLACPGYVQTIRIGMTDELIPSGYLYVTGLTDKNPGSVMVAFDASPDNHAGRGRNILFLDGHVQFCSEQDFQERLNKQKDSFVVTDVRLPLAALRSIAELHRTTPEKK